MQTNVQKQIGTLPNQRQNKQRFDDDTDLSIGKNPLNEYVEEKDVEDVQEVTDDQTVVGSEDDQTQTGDNEDNQTKFRETKVDKTEFG